MEQNPNVEALKRRVIELEKKLKEFERKGTHRNLQEVAKRLEKIAEMGDDGIIVFDEDYRIEFANVVASELTGYEKEQLIGMDFRRLLNERDIGYLNQMHSEVGADESKRVCTEMEVLTESGLKRDAEVCITIAKKEKDGMETYAYLRDVTERKRMEGEIRDATRRFEKIAEMGEDGIIVFDDDSRIEFANQMASEIMGLPKDQILGREFFSLIGKRDEEFLEEMVMRGEGMGEKVCTEMSLHTAPGKVKETEVCIAPTQSEDGRIKTYAYLRDITERKRFERELKESEQKFRNLFERVRHGLFISTREGRFLDCNQALLEMAGYENKEAFLKIDIARDLYVNPEDRKAFQKLIERQGFVKDLEVEFKKKSGEKITVLLTAHPIQNEKGEIVGYEGINIDISERKRIENELREANEFFMNLIESSVDGIIAANMKGDIFIFNKGAEALTGYTAQEVIGKIHITDIYLEGVAKEVMRKLRSPDYGGKGKLLPNQITIVNKTGEEIPVQLSAALIYHEAGKELASVGIFTDLRPRLKMEKELKEANEFLMKLIESSVDGIIVTNIKGDILIYNQGAEKILGYKAEEVMGKMNIRNIYPPGVAKEVIEKLKSPDFGGIGKLTSFPILHRKKDGELIEGDLSAAMIYDGEGKEIASIGIFKDLRERLRIERELQKMQEALLQSEKLAAMGRLTSQIAHELNNPIYGIMNTLELLKTEIPPESKRRRILELSLSEIQRLSEMLRNMLSFSKPEEEKRRPIKIDELIEGILLVMEKQMRESNIQVDISFDPDIPEIMASTNQMRQVMLNILKNGKEAMPKGGILTVRTVRERDNVLIHIQDTGMGIPEEIRDKIFDAFFTTKQKVKGVGLGLSVCYGIIKDHGGEIKVESEEGKGTTFTIRLPIESQKEVLRVP